MIKHLVKKALIAFAGLSLIAGGAISYIGATTQGAGADSNSGSWSAYDTHYGNWCSVTGYHVQNLYDYAVANTDSSGNFDSCSYAWVELDYFYLGVAYADSTDYNATATSPYQTYPTYSYHQICDVGGYWCSTEWSLN